jgi:hypothetical protein
MLLEERRGLGRRANRRLSVGSSSCGARAGEKAKGRRLTPLLLDCSAHERLEPVSTGYSHDLAQRDCRCPRRWPVASYTSPRERFEPDASAVGLEVVVVEFEEELVLPSLLGVARTLKPFPCQSARERPRRRRSRRELDLRGAGVWLRTSDVGAGVFCELQVFVPERLDLGLAQLLESSSPLCAPFAARTSSSSLI